MSSTYQSVKRAASAEPPITLQDKPQLPKRAASAEPQSTNQSKRQKLQEQDDEEEGATSKFAPGDDSGAQPEQIIENVSERQGGEEPEDDSDDGEAEDLPKPSEKKVCKRSEQMKIVDKFTVHGNDTGFFSKELKKKGHDSRPELLPDDRKRLMEDLAKEITTSTPHGPSQVGLDFMSEFSTAVDSPKDAATFLGIDLQSLEISRESSLRLRIDQVQNIAFMVKKAEGILKGCVNANDYGTGKTIEALASIFFLAQRREACADSARHKASLILCPHQSLRGWQDAHAQYFSGLLTLRICSNSLPPGQHSQLIDPPSASALDEFLKTLLPSDPHTSRTVILCTYGELSSEGFLVKRDTEDAREKELSLRRSKLNEEALEALKVAQKPVLYDLDFNPEMIGTLIADEAHEIKHPKSRKAQTAYLLDTDIQFLLTANPVHNKVSDFRGLLFALYKSEEWQINWPEDENSEGILRMFDDDFDPFEDDDSEDYVPHNASPEYVQALRNGQHLWRLNPHAYRWLGHHMKYGPEFSRKVLGSIYRLCLLRRGVVSVFSMPSGESSTISGILAMPPVSIRTIEVSMSHGKYEYYDLASQAFDLIFTGDGKNSNAGAARVINDNETPVAAFSNFWDAFLSHITADLGLADVVGNSWSSEAPASRKTRPDINNLRRNNTDSGMSFYYSMTRRDTDPVEPPADRESMIRYLVRRSPKLQWLLVKLEELKEKGEKVVVYCVHPLTQWLVEGVCSMADFNFLSLRSKPKHDDETRTTVIDKFNDPGERYDFLLSTMRVLGHGVDLHADCHNMIIFELPENVPTILSAIGRIRRVGQTKPQEVSILTMRDSYDDYTLYRQSRKHATAILAFGVLGERLDKLASHVAAQVEENRLIRREEMSKTGEALFMEKLKREMPIMEVVKLLAAGELLRRHLGARYNTGYIPWHCRHKILFRLQQIMKLSDFAGENMAFNTVTGRQILRQVAQLPATGQPPPGVEDLARRFWD